MRVSKTYLSLQLPMLALSLSLILTACGGGSSSISDTPVPPPPPEPATTGTVGLLITDMPTEDFKEINLKVIEATLIGDDGQQILFQGEKHINLLDLTNFNEPIVFGEVDAGTYTKLRLFIDQLELVPWDENLPIVTPIMPANGKIDLLDPSGIPVLPGRTLLAEIDMDANKSIKVTGAGNSGNYTFRPVVRVKFMEGGELPDKLTRLEGTVSEKFNDPNSFVLCAAESSDNCVTVSVDETSCLFDNEGLATDFSGLDVGNDVVVIGRYDIDDSGNNTESILQALIVEIGGNSEQVKGNAVSAPESNQFLMLADDDSDLVIELQADTKYFDANGPLATDAIVLGSDVEVEGVRAPKADEIDPDIIRAALVFVEDETDEQISGTITDSLDVDLQTFDLMLEDGSTVCVRLDDSPSILFVDTANSEVTVGTFDQLAPDQAVDLFGTTGETCFEANEVIVEGPPPASP